MKKYITFVVVSMGFLALAACSLFNSGRELADPIWLLFELNGERPLPDTNITAEFDEDGKVGGSGGCNSYNTTYTVDGENIEFGEQIASTLMACFDPVMEQERAYFQALSDARRYEIADDELTLYDSGGNAVASFMALDQSLSGSSWDVIAYNNGRGGVTSLIIGSAITANFGEGGQLTGNAGCNNYFADYSTDDDEIDIGPAGSTLMMCSEPEGVMQQESEYLAALDTADTYKVKGVTMEMRTSQGSLVATFQRALTP